MAASTASTLRRRIEIPFFDKEDQVIEIDTADLPSPVELVGLLRDQKNKISKWIELAYEFYRQDKKDSNTNKDAFETILSECLLFADSDIARSCWTNYPDKDKDRIKVLDLLAIYYVRQAYKEKNRDKRREYFAKAAQKFTEVDRSEFISISKHGSEYQFHLLGRAYCCLVEGRTDQAEQQFNFVLQQQQQSGESEIVPSLLGRACIEFNKKEANSKKAAMSFYKKALQVCPTCPADVRLGLGICFYKLNMFEKAELAFTKALSLNQKCIGALAGLAVIELNKKTSASIKKGVEYLVKAYKIDQERQGSDPMILTLLADHYFYRNKLVEAIKLANRALESTENEAMLAQACYQLARAYHKQEDYNNAFDFYYKATQFGGTTFALAHYGLGQMYINRNEFDPAVQAFEVVLKSNPENIETLKVLASLYARSNSQTKKDLAKTYLKKVTQSQPNDLEAWIELASLIETNETQAALTAYQTALKLYEERSEQPPPEIYNNVAALLFSTNALEQAEEHYNKALTICEENLSSNEHHYGSIVFTIRYNIARLYESKNQLSEAESLYKSILKQHPMYIDCYLRLGCMERDKGQIFNASDKFKETFRVEPDNADAWILIGNLHLSKQEWGPAQKKFERILERTKAKPDCYSLISVGNVWLQNQYQANIRDKDKLNHQRQRALAFYKSALGYDHKNIYAANGIGCILAVEGMYNEARDVFSQVREATADFPDVWINIAHIYVEQRQYVAAVQMYENCLKKFYANANTEILCYIARALFKANKLADCKKVLLRARTLSPQDMTILFNLAKVLKAISMQVFADNKSSFNDVVAAEEELKLARTYFNQYLTMMAKDKNAIDPEIVKKEAEECDDTMKQVESNIKKNAERRDREEQQRRLEHEERLKEEEKKKKEGEARLLEEQRLKKEEQEARRRELLKKQEEERIRQRQAEESSSKIIDDGSDEEGAEKPRKKKKKEKRQSSQGEKRERERSEKEEQSAIKKFKSRALLSSDDESSSDE